MLNDTDLFACCSVAVERLQAQLTVVQSKSAAEVCGVLCSAASGQSIA